MFQMNLIKKLKTSYRIRMSSDNRYLCHIMGSKTIVFDLKSWDKIAELDKPKHPFDMRFSKNNEYLLIKSTTGTICIYDISDFQLIKTIQSNNTFKIVAGDVNFTQDNLMILDTLATKDGKQIVSINFNTGGHTILSDFKNSITRIEYNHFVTKEDFHLFTLSYENNSTGFRDSQIIKVKEPINKKSIESIGHPDISSWDAVIFDSIHGVYILIIEYTIILVDSDFKRVLKKQDFVNNDYPQDQIGFIRHIHLSNDGRFIVLTFNESIFILRYEDLNTILLEKIPYACFAEFSNDDQYLLVGTWKNGYVLENNLQ